MKPSSPSVLQALFFLLASLPLSQMATFAAEDPQPEIVRLMPAPLQAGTPPTPANLTKIQILLALDGRTVLGLGTTRPDKDELENRLIMWGDEGPKDITQPLIELYGEKPWPQMRILRGSLSGSKVRLLIEIDRRVLEQKPGKTYHMVDLNAGKLVGKVDLAPALEKAGFVNGGNIDSEFEVFGCGTAAPCTVLAWGKNKNNNSLLAIEGVPLRKVLTFGRVPVKNGVEEFVEAGGKRISRDFRHYPLEPRATDATHVLFHVHEGNGSPDAIYEASLSDLRPVVDLRTSAPRLTQAAGIPEALASVPLKSAEIRDFAAGERGVCASFKLFSEGKGGQVQCEGILEVEEGKVKLLTSNTKSRIGGGVQKQGNLFDCRYLTALPSGGVVFEAIREEPAGNRRVLMVARAGTAPQCIFAENPYTGEGKPKWRFPGLTKSERYASDECVALQVSVSGNDGWALVRLPGATK